jgi:hypothetical protein
MLVIKAGTLRDFGELCVTGRQLRSESLLGEVPEVVKIGHALLARPPPPPLATTSARRKSHGGRTALGFGPLCFLFGHLPDLAFQWMMMAIRMTVRGPLGSTIMY